MSRAYPTLPAEVADGTPHALRVSHRVASEEEGALAAGVAHLVGWRTLRRVPKTIDHDAAIGTSPDGSTFTINSPAWQRGPFATSVAVRVQAEVASDGASLDPSLALTLQHYTGGEWVDVDAPDGEGGGPGTAYAADDLAGGEAVEFQTIDFDWPDPEVPSLYPTGPRALTIPDAVPAGDLLRVVVDCESVRPWLIVVRELRET